MCISPTCDRLANVKHKIQNSLSRRLPLFISIFLHDRYFRVRLGNVLSARYPEESGMPQGSVLKRDQIRNRHKWASECGWFICLDVTECRRYCRFVRFPEHDTIERRLQLAVCRLSRWAPESDISFSTAKTQCVHCTCLWDLHRRHTLSPFVPSVKFLCRLDSEIAWEPYLKCLRI